MPDFERLTRNLRLHLESDPQKRALIEAEHRGESRARRQIAFLVLGLAVGWIIGHLIFN